MSIEGSRPLSPQERAEYKQDFAKSADLFQQSLQGYKSADEVHKKEKFKEVMQETLQIMNQTAKVCLNERAQAEESKLNEDYQGFDGSAASYQKLSADIQHLKELL